MSEYPEHEKLKEIQPKSQAIHEFIDWVSTEHGIELSSDHRMPRLTNLVAEFFDIDLNKINAEKDAMVEEMRRHNERRQSRLHDTQG